MSAAADTPKHVFTVLLTVSFCHTGWGPEDELRLFFLGSELHPLWLLDDCGVQDLCQMRIARRRALVNCSPKKL